MRLNTRSRQGGRGHKSASFVVAVRANFRVMNKSGEEIISRIEERLAVVGLSESAASVNAGLSRDAIRSIRRNIASGKGRGVSSTTINKLAPVLQTSPDWLLTGIVHFPDGDGGFRANHIESSSILPDNPADHQATVPLVGYVGAGALAHFYAVSQGDLDQVPAPEGSTKETVVVEIRGDSLGKFLDRWLVAYDDVRHPMTDDLIGKLCVVGLEDDRVLIKQIRRSPCATKFALHSENEPPIEDAKITWAARVKALVAR